MSGPASAGPDPGAWDVVVTVPGPVREWLAGFADFAAFEAQVQAAERAGSPELKALWEGRAAAARALAAALRP